jgi:rhodanese-related sulfurtransferase
MSSRCWREPVWLAAAALVFTTFPGITRSGSWAQAESTAPISLVRLVTLEEVRRFPEVLWVDARSREAYEMEHIPKAVLLNAFEWEDLATQFLDAWDPDIPIVVYCDSASCDASTRVAERLRSEMGIRNVFVLEGGWETWKKAHQ